MNKLLDNGLVALALAASGFYALLALGPKSLRRFLWAALARAAASAPPALHLAGLARRLDAVAGKISSACGGCETCGPEPSKGAAAGGEGNAPEIRVPLAQVGKRGSSMRR
jgi:hypothetical protein